MEHQETEQWKKIAVSPTRIAQYNTSNKIISVLWLWNFTHLINPFSYSRTATSNTKNTLN